MGVLHNELEGGPLGRAIRAALGIKEGEKTIERFGETLTPIIDLYSDVTWDYLLNKKHFSRTDQIVGVAAKNSTVALVNPAGSNNIVVLERVDGNPAANGSVELSISTQALIQAALVQLAGGFFTDIRNTKNSIGQGLSVAQIWEGTNAGIIGTVFDKFWRLANNPQPLRSVNAIIPPGFGILMAFTTVNVTFDWILQGYERKALAGELP